MTDYLIVGCGLAGIAFAETALNAGKTIMVVDDAQNTSSAVAAGLYNPVILKRFSGLQHAQQQLIVLQDFYNQLEAKIGTQVNHRMPVWRKFQSVEEQNNWFAAADKPSMRDFMSTELRFETLPHIESPFGYGEVLQTGFVDTRLLIQAYKRYLREHQILTETLFDYALLESTASGVRYGDMAAKHLIFAEGFGVKQNPFFGSQLLNGTKGELLLIKAEALQLDVVVKAGLFILPMGDGLFKVGATYEWTDKTAQPTQAAREELIAKLGEIIDCEYEILQQWAGIRPTTPDRKAVLGTHREHPQLHILNGLGTRGVMLAPYMATLLFDHIENQTAIPPELDFQRFV